ncbi:MAG: peptidoglycan DD-metalloendopeptidase family protein [Anaerolineales bacterium]|nr:peptidoglycan DD-metalloendopeptidase family protein [Anaerolineales bacterium]
MDHATDWANQSLYHNLAQEFGSPLLEETAVSPPAIPNPMPPDAVPTDDALSIVGLALLILLAYVVLNGIFSNHRAAAETAATATPPATVAAVPALPDPNLILAPYGGEYWVTQGVHGSSYGHMAIDIAAGKGSVILSPINGEVTAVYTDQYGNPTLVIENSRYTVTLLHGFYDVVVSQQLHAGDSVGSEGNLGYTTDMAGNRCQTRDCGYHTHLNIYDKQLGSNVNPLNLIEN